MMNDTLQNKTPAAEVTPTFSFFTAPVCSIIPSATFTLADAYRYIRGVTAMAATERLRSLLGKRDRSAYKSQHFDFCTFSGLFSRRMSNGLEHHSGLLCLDFDHLAGPDPTPEAAEAAVYGLMPLIASDKNIRPRLLFRSPSGDGLKVVVAIDLNAGTHLDYFQALARYFKEGYDEVVDPACKDVTRACFLPHDAKAMFSVPKDDFHISRPFLQRFSPGALPSATGMTNGENALFAPSAANAVGPALNASNAACAENDLSSAVATPTAAAAHAAATPTSPTSPTSSTTAAPTDSPTSATQVPVSEREHQMLRVEAVVQSIEASGIDITAQYSDWCDAAFALNHTFGEEGREWFHRISRFYPRYNVIETDRKYSQCAQPGNITIATLFALAKRFGVEPPHLSKTPPTCSAPSENEDVPAAVDAPQAVEAMMEETLVASRTFARQRAEHLPLLLQKVVASAETAEQADVLLLGALTVLSAVMPNVRAMHHGHYYSPHIYLFVAGAASCGKGQLAVCRHLLDSINNAYTQQYESALADYQSQLNHYIMDRRHNEEPNKPPRLMLFIPANSSNAAFYKALAENGGNGLIFETEGDTLSNAIKSDFGNYSDILRKAFHHEEVSLYRKTNDEYISIKEPHLAVALSGTPAQIPELIPSAENGLFSRFLFYCMSGDPKWHNGFDPSEDCEDFVDDGASVAGTFASLSEDVYRLFCQLKSRIAPLRFCFTPEQKERFNDFFSHQKRALYTSDCAVDNGSVSSVHRMAIITIRLAMVLSTLRFLDRKEDPSLPPVTVMRCSEEDFDTAIAIAATCLGHDDDVNQMLNAAHPADGKCLLPVERLYAALPSSFTSAQAINIAKSKNISRTASFRILKSMQESGFLARTSHGAYRKCVPV